MFEFLLNSILYHRVRTSKNVHAILHHNYKYKLFTFPKNVYGNSVTLIGLLSESIETGIKFK